MKAILALLLLGCLTFVSGCTTNCATSSRPSKLVILKATYGVKTATAVDITDEVQSLVKNGSLHLHPQWAFGVDPAYGVVKRVTIAYRYKGHVEVASFDQFEDLILPSNQ
jgi:hypothetical protein